MTISHKLATVKTTNLNKLNPFLMARTLKAEPSKLIWLMNLTDVIPPSIIRNALKLSTFRRALKLALKSYTDGQDKILEVYKADYQEYNAKSNEFKKQLEDEKDEKKHAPIKKQIDEVEKAISDLQKEADEKIKEYAEANKGNLSVAFDNEAFNYTKDIFSEAASVLFSQVTKDKDGNIKQEKYNPAAADELFELLDKAK